MKNYATFDKSGNQTGFTTLEAPTKSHYEISDIGKKWKLVNGKVQEVTISELYKDELNLAKQQKLEQINNDYLATLKSDVTTSAEHTWKADKQVGIEKTAERINNKRTMAIARNQDSMTFVDADGKIVNLKVGTGDEIDDALTEALEIGDFVESAFALKYQRKKQVADARDIDALGKI